MCYHLVYKVYKVTARGPLPPLLPCHSLRLKNYLCAPLADSPTTSSIRLTAPSDLESPVSVAMVYEDKRDASQLTESDGDDDDAFQSFYESVHSDLQSLSTGNKVSEVQCRRNAEADGFADRCR